MKLIVQPCILLIFLQKSFIQWLLSTIPFTEYVFDGEMKLYQKYDHYDVEKPSDKSNGAEKGEETLVQISIIESLYLSVV